MPNTNPLVSVIIPAYNVGEHLARCMQALAAQSYQNLEILLIDDGSTDETPRLCDEYAAKDARICVVHKQNGGPSEARNVALDMATGSVISFIDSDDFFSPDYYACLVQLLEEYHCDISACSYARGTAESFPPESEGDAHAPLLLKGPEGMKALLYQKFNGALWGKLYRKHLFNDVRFPVGKLHADIDVNYRVFALAENSVYTTRKLYYYYQWPESIVHSSFVLKHLDSVEFTGECIAYTKRSCPAAYKAAVSRHFSACFETLTKFKNKQDHPKEQQYLYRQIKQYRKTVLTDGEARFKNRAAAALCYLDVPLAAKLARLVLP